MEEAVFGNAFGVRVKGTALVVSLDGLVSGAEEEIRQRHDEGYSDAFCEILLVANDLGVDVVSFAADGGVCRDLCLFDGNKIVVMRPFKRFIRHC
ncbi:hypothetical protein [Roseibium sp.]|uniref:hypothetical protein n=1 Tax=Roseibium sp. TaxID=1936156 RepID=UPI0039198E10